jgi:hypothetical protein
MRFSASIHVNFQSALRHGEEIMHSDVVGARRHQLYNTYDDIIQYTALFTES